MLAGAAGRQHLPPPVVPLDANLVRAHYERAMALAAAYRSLLEDPVACGGGGGMGDAHPGQYSGMVGLPALLPLDPYLGLGPGVAAFHPAALLGAHPLPGAGGASAPWRALDAAVHPSGRLPVGAATGAAARRQERGFASPDFPMMPLLATATQHPLVEGASESEGPDTMAALAVADAARRRRQATVAIKAEPVQTMPPPQHTARQAVSDASAQPSSPG